MAVTVIVPGVSVERIDDAVDAALGVEIQVVGRVELVGAEAAAPDNRAADGEVHAGLVGRAAAALGVDDLEVDQGHVGAVGLQAFRAACGR